MTTFNFIFPQTTENNRPQTTDIIFHIWNTSYTTQTLTIFIIHMYLMSGSKVTYRSHTNHKSLHYNVVITVLHGNQPLLKYPTPLNFTGLVQTNMQQL